MAELVGCERCQREHSARLARCPFCNAPRVTADDGSPFRANAPPPPVETRTKEEIEREARLRAAMVAMSSCRGDDGGTLAPSRLRVWLSRLGAVTAVIGALMLIAQSGTSRPLQIRGAEALMANDVPRHGFVLDARIDWEHGSYLHAPPKPTRYYAEIAGSGGRLWVVAWRQPIKTTSRLYGSYAACPSATCSQLGDPKGAQGYFLARRWPPTRTYGLPLGITALALGLLLLFAPLLTRRLYR
ncbi:MAG: hypothetical protein KC503_30980 [Myxococcales bacterium]|nr:hypothetical protein [Myxococcales bacterium]